MLGEGLAVDFLVKKGYRILERNYRFERGEIDIVAEEKDELVFVEVKARGSKSFGEPEDAVTIGKQKKIRYVAEGYLFQHHIDGKTCRFDVVTVKVGRKEPEIQHYENAF
jgi:putative endonuclease